MKLKYYLRGLGIGIVMAVLITGVSMGRKQTMTDDEVKARAKELGMIENSVLAERIPEETAEDNGDNEPEDAPDDTDKEPEDTPVDVDKEPEDTPEGTEKEPEDAVAEEKDVVSVTVVSGDTSWTVSKRMEEAGLIESAKDFDTHLCRYGYDKKISVGTYKIPVNASHEEMAKILTKSE